MSAWAVCRHCNAPLISTLAFPRAEFYCLECGREYGFLGPARGDDSPEMQARHDALRAEWDTLVAPFLMTPRSWRLGCDTCRGGFGPYHSEHLTDEERRGDEWARAWLRWRTTVHVNA